jgi:hypothetical protein
VKAIKAYATDGAATGFGFQALGWTCVSSELKRQKINIDCCCQVVSTPASYSGSPGNKPRLRDRLSLYLSLFYSLPPRKCRDKVKHSCLATATLAPRGKGGITPTYSSPRHSKGVSGQCHVPATLYSGGKNPRYPLDTRLCGPQSWSGHRGYRKNRLPLPGIEPQSPSL